MKDFSYAGLDLVRDLKSRSEAYYCRNQASVAIDGVLIDALKAHLEATGSGLMRLCLHSSPNSTLHDMVIVQKRGAAYKPHKHIAKEECYHMLEGKLRIDFFNDAGEMTATTVIGATGSGLAAICRVRAGVWHSTTPESDYAVIHESRPGPFTGADSAWPDW